MEAWLAAFTRKGAQVARNSKVRCLRKRNISGTSRDGSVAICGFNDGYKMQLTIPRAVVQHFELFGISPEKEYRAILFSGKK